MDFQCIKYSKASYIAFIEKANAQLTDHLNDPELFQLFKTYQVHFHCRMCWKYNKNMVHMVSYGPCFTEKKIIAKPLDSEFTNDEK